MPKIALGITGLLEILGRDYGIEEPYWGPSWFTFGKQFKLIMRQFKLHVKLIITEFKLHVNGKRLIQVENISK